MTRFATDAWVARLAWLGLLHALWLGLALASLVGLGFRIRPGLSRRARSGVLMAALGMVAVGPAVLAVGQDRAGGRASRSRGTEGWITIGRGGPGGWVAAPPPSPGRPEPRWLDRVARGWESAAAAIRAARPSGLAAWSAATLGSLGWLAAGAFGVARLVGRSEMAPDPIRDRGRAIAARMGLGRIPEVRVAPGLAEPCLCGIVRPVVILPAAWLDRAGRREVDAAIAHELAHARRLDPLAHLIQRLIEASLGWHPGVRRLSTALRLEREHAADALAARSTGDPLGLALALESVARFRLDRSVAVHPRTPGLVLGVSSPPLTSRIQELLGMKPQNPRPSARPLLAMIPLAGLCAALAGAVGSAQEPTPAKPPAAPAVPTKSDAPRSTGQPAGSRDAAVRPAAGKAEPGGEISYEVRFAFLEPDAWGRPLRDGLPRVKVEGAEGWIAGPKQAIDFLEAIGGRTTTNLVQAPKVTAFEAAHAVINLNPRPGGPAGQKVDLSGTIGPDLTRLLVNARSADGAPTEKNVTIRYDVPEGSTLILGMGRRNREVDAVVRVEETLILVTPRRILSEAEENRLVRH